MVVTGKGDALGLSFWCHNVQKSSVSYTALLAEWGEDGPDVVCVQEPPWIQVGTQRSLIYLGYPPHDTYEREYSIFG